MNGHATANPPWQWTTFLGYWTLFTSIYNKVYQLFGCSPGYPFVYLTLGAEELPSPWPCRHTLSPALQLIGGSTIRLVEFVAWPAVFIHHGTHMDFSPTVETSPLNTGYGCVWRSGKLHTHSRIYIDIDIDICVYIYRKTSLGAQLRLQTGFLVTPYELGPKTMDPNQGNLPISRILGV